MVNLKQSFKKFWHFIWEEDSIWSWLANVLLAIILIKFIIYPALGFALDTKYPIVAVVSGSMEHHGDFDTWWQKPAICDVACTQGEFYTKLNITKDKFENFKFKNGFNKGDIMILSGVSPDKVNIGDVLVYTSVTPDPIIHRAILMRENNGKYSYTTKGDFNPTINPHIFEADIDQSRLLGKAVFRIPFLGWLKITAYCGYTSITTKDTFVACMVR